MRALDDEGQCQHLAAFLDQFDRRVHGTINALDLLAGAQVAPNLGGVLGMDAERDASARAAAVEAQHEARARPRAPVMHRIDAETAPEPGQFSAPRLGVAKARAPHERAVGEDPMLGRVHARASGLGAGRRALVPAEVRRGGVLACGDDAFARRAGLREQAVQRLAVAEADRALQDRDVLGEAAEHLQRRLLVVEEYVAPHHRIGGGNPREIAEAAGRELDDLAVGHPLEMPRGVDDAEGDEVRQMAGDGQHHVVMGCVHGLDVAAAGTPEGGQLLHGFGRRALDRREDAPAAVEELGKAGLGARMLGARDGVAGDEVDARRHMRADVAHHRTLHRAHVREDRALGEMRRDFLGDGRVDADGGAQDDEVGAFHGIRRRLVDAVDEAQPFCGVPRARALGEARDVPRQPGAAHGVRQGRADETDADQRDAREEGRCRLALRGHFRPMNSASAATTA